MNNNTHHQVVLLDANTPESILLQQELLFSNAKKLSLDSLNLLKKLIEDEDFTIYCETTDSLPTPKIFRKYLLAQGWKNYRIQKCIKELKNFTGEVYGYSH